MTTMPTNPDGTLIESITDDDREIEVWLLPPRTPTDEIEYALIVDGRVITYVRASHVRAVELLYLAMRVQQYERLTPWREPGTVAKVHPACVCAYEPIEDGPGFLLVR